MHTPDWRQSLGELCRVARHRVVFDYPALASAAALQALTRRAARAAGADVEAYRVFSDRPVGARARRATASAWPSGIASSCCRSRCTSGSARLRSPPASRARWRALGLPLRCSDRR